MRQDQIKASTNMNKTIQGAVYQAAAHGVKTLQPVTMETHKKDYDLERKRKAKAKIEGAAA